ncbi:glycoside hydrolase family 3 C-terminal domain-containing protein [Cellulosimicrobium sp. Marseille-Q4280]|uniref:glycoside hydrolase family 3 C-terminal domain-containing protein n=1 Tax=Cellulosimicrobium sp. Marseille-Q4280 TaxID=2937992 RepID=UPI00203AB3F1|nr:glycoside hydrolase family 3 C-terminal domain-containing protein [Cellulosimicrobium sp. Marseille-Q4280]
MTTTSPAALDDAARLLFGADMASTRASDDVPRLVLSDGPSGLAMNLPGFAGKVPATSFPAPVALAATWDVGLVEQVGAAIGAEARAAGADVLLGPSVNIKRSPLGGRNFEYYSEDPRLAGRAGAAFVRGVQSEGVGACVKHFAVNSQETDRMRVSAEVDERALREIYLPAFEHVVREARPAMVMASYNRVNGVHAAQDPWLLTRVLREEWGFDGAVVSDWGAVDDPVAAVAAGLDLQMPGPADASRDAVLDAVADGRLDTECVLDAAGRLASVARRWSGRPARTVDRAAHQALARRVAEASVVLLRNEGGTLPLRGAGTLLVVGELARAPHREGGGSAHVGTEVPETSGDTPLDALRAVWDGEVRFEPGYPVDGQLGASGTSDDGAGTDAADLAIRRQAQAADAVVLVVGPPAGSDSEGYDRDTIDLPAEQVRLIEAVAGSGTPTVVVINAGGVVRTSPWDRAVGAVVHMWLPGASGGGAVVDVLTGVTNPSGRLPETFPVSLRDTPAWPGFPATGGRAFHAEGTLVGYRWYDRAEKDVAYPFGHGLSYTTFAYSGLEAVEEDEEHVRLRFTLTNTGDRAGAEVWQAYAGREGAGPTEPVRRLVGFGRVHLEAGGSAEVDLTVDRRGFATWDQAAGGWAVTAGDHAVEVGASSRDLRARVIVPRSAHGPRPRPTLRSTLREWVEDDVLGPRLLDAVAAADPSGSTTGFLTSPVIRAMIGDMPIARLLADPANALSTELLDGLLDTTR